MALPWMNDFRGRQIFVWAYREFVRLVKRIKLFYEVIKTWLHRRLLRSASACSLATENLVQESTAACIRGFGLCVGLVFTYMLNKTHSIVITQLNAVESVAFDCHWYFLAAVAAALSFFGIVVMMSIDC